MLVVMSGLPGTGKTTIARALARAVRAVHLRVDSIEQALRNEGIAVGGEGYGVAYAVAEDNLRTGLVVIADSVNPWPETRTAWHEVAKRAEVRARDVEVVCSAIDEHRRRVESRRSDLPGHLLPTWRDVVDRDYLPWESERLVIDTSRVTPAEAVATIRAALALS